MTATFNRTKTLSVDDFVILEKQISYNNEMIGIIENSLSSIKDLIKKWNGKAYNKRFETSLKQINSNFYIDRDDYSISLNIELWDKRSTPSKEREFGTLYVPYDHQQLFYKSKGFHDSCVMITEDLIEQVEQRLQAIKTSNEQLRKDYNNLDNILEEYNYIQIQISNFVHKTHHLIRNKIGDFKNY